MLNNANLWVLHYLDLTKTGDIIGLHMCQETQELLERSNNTKESQYHLK